jgi:hypothetical protein
MGSKNFVISGKSATIKCDKIQNIILADEELQISHLNGKDIGDGFAWPSIITVSPGEHIINLKYRQPSGFDIMSKAISIAAHKKYDKSFQVFLLPDKTYIARLKPIMESTFLGPKRIGVDMWVEEELTGKIISKQVEPIHQEVPSEMNEFDEEI